MGEMLIDVIDHAGSFYSDLPLVESVGVTLQYAMGAPLHSPIWLDGYQFFRLSILPMRDECIL